MIRWSPGMCCLVNGCPTRVQRTPDGTLVDGHVAHLETVHNLESAEARRLVEKISSASR